MSPILTRPMREQFEHDRVIRLLQARYKRKHDVAINPGAEQNESVMAGELEVYPDLLLFSSSRRRVLEATVEVETVESVNQLEALAEWGMFGRLPVPFHLYVPPQALESAKRMCANHGFRVSEIWTYHMAIDQVRFTLVHRAQVVHVGGTVVTRKAAPKPVVPKDVPAPAVIAAVATPPAGAPVKAAKAVKAVPAAKLKVVVATPAPVKKEAAARAAAKKVVAKPVTKLPVKKVTAVKKVAAAKKPVAAAARKPIGKKRR